MKVYTRTGDKGKTRLICGCLTSKADLRIEAYGSVDELNSVLGLIIVELASTPTLASKPKLKALQKQLELIQNELFNLGSLFACEKVEKIPELPPIHQNLVNRLENEIDDMTESLPELRNFILPGGGKLSALLHMARTICRRAERNSVKLFEKHPEVEIGMVYLNRLSDYFFTSARFVNHELDIHEVHWSKPN